MKIFMFCGKARSGKDTSALMLKEMFEENGKKVLILQYSTYIKDFAKKISDWDGSEETKPRELLQQLGTDIIRKKIDNLFFIKRLIEDLKVYEFFFDVIIISDVRFESEIEEPKKVYENIVSVKIYREGSTGLLTEKQNLHATETGLDNYNNFDVIINNSGTIDELKVEIRKLVENEY